METQSLHGSPTLLSAGLAAIFMSPTVVFQHSKNSVLNVPIYTCTYMYMYQVIVSGYVHQQLIYSIQCTCVSEQ